jgi:hypothetical protein
MDCADCMYVSYVPGPPDEHYFEIRLYIGIFGVIISCNSFIVHQQMNTLLLFGLDLLDESLDFFFLADITWQTEGPFRTRSIGLSSYYLRNNFTGASVVLFNNSIKSFLASARNVHTSSIADESLSYHKTNSSAPSGHYCRVIRDIKELVDLQIFVASCAGGHGSENWERRFDEVIPKIVRSGSHKQLQHFKDESRICWDLWLLFRAVMTFNVNDVVELMPPNLEPQP